MGVVERIRQIQEDATRKAAEAEAARVVEWIRTEPERLAALEAQKQEELMKKQRQEEIIRESGIKEKLQQIEQEFLQQTTHHLYINQRAKGAHYYGGYTYHDNEVVYELAWNYRKSQEQPDRISGYNYDSITVYLNIDNGRINIHAREGAYFEDKSKWFDNKSVIDEALARAYFSPSENSEPAETWSIN